MDVDTGFWLAMIIFWFAGVPVLLVGKSICAELEAIRDRLPILDEDMDEQGEEFIPGPDQ